jgi:mRNA-degrading endonuclease YafQ of YafQ-DinJ toxin-antitoxin module
LRAHKIHRLSAALGKTVYAVEIEADLRVIFYLDGETVRTVDIGSHDVYER